MGINTFPTPQDFNSSDRQIINDIKSYVDTEVASILAAVDTEVAAIKAKTDNLVSAKQVPTLTSFNYNSTTEPGGAITNHVSLAGPKIITGGHLIIHYMENYSTLLIEVLIDGSTVLSVQGDQFAPSSPYNYTSGIRALVPVHSSSTSTFTGLMPLPNLYFASSFVIRTRNTETSFARTTQVSGGIWSISA